MVLKRNVREGGEEGSDLPSKRRHFVNNLLRGANYGRAMQEVVPYLEPMLRKIVQEEVAHAIHPYLRSSENQVLLPRRLQLQIHSNLPHTLFTNSRVLSKDKSPVRIVLFDSISNQVITSGPLSSLKVTIVVLDSDFGPDDREDWTTDEFEKKLVKNREGKRPLVTGDLIVSLQNGVGHIGEISFTDNSSWIRSGKFRLGAKANNSSSESTGIREAMSGAFKVKDHRGESYQKHHPPSLDDEVWRLEKIAKDGPSHKKLSQCGIYCVRDFLRLYFTDQSTLRNILQKTTNRSWEAIISHAQTCTLDDTKYIYRTTQGTGLLFSSIYKAIGVTYDGQTYLPLDSLNKHQMSVVEHLKQHAYKNLMEWVTVSDPSIVGYPMLMQSASADSFTNPNLGLHGLNFQDQPETDTNSDHPTLSPQYKSEMEQDNCSFEFGESSHSMHGFNPTLGNSFGMNDSPGGFYIGGQPSWASGVNYAGSQLSTDDLPIDDNFQVESSAWHGNGLFLDRRHDIGILSTNTGIIIPRNRRSKTRWCKVLAVIKWQIMVRRARKWRHAYGYM